MGLLYEMYASPNELINRMLKMRKFNDFVKNVFKRRNEEAEKENDNKLWLSYVLSMSDIPFNEWKKGLYQKKEKEPVSYGMTDAQVESAKQNARGILKGFAPK